MKLSSLQKYNIEQNYRVLHSSSAFVPMQPQNFAASPYLKASSNNLMLYIKLVDVPMIFYCTRIYRSKSSGHELFP